MKVNEAWRADIERNIRLQKNMDKMEATSPITRVKPTTY